LAEKLLWPQSGLDGEAVKEEASMAQKQEKRSGPVKQEKGSAALRGEKPVTSSAVPVKRVTEAPVPVRSARHLWPMSAWEREIDRLFDDFRRRMNLPSAWDLHRWWPAVEFELHTPAVDVFEKGDEVIVKAEVPGISKDRIEVKLTDTMLTLSGEKSKEEEVKDHDYYRCERSFGSFSRTVELPATVKTDAATATFKDGVLEIHIPKTEQAKQKQIKVEVK
jgi:HSP20 family protein